jgi:hypothetical protein
VQRRRFGEMGDNVGIALGSPLPASPGGKHYGVPLNTSSIFGVPCFQAWGGKNGCPQAGKTSHLQSYLISV